MDNILIKENEVWIRYFKKNAEYEIDEVGKWMFFFNSSDKLLKKYSELCKLAVLNGITDEVKISKPNDQYPKEVCIFYCNYDDIETHKKIIKFMMDNNLIDKTINGRYYNISFKLDIQTLLGVYGNDFKAILKLENFIDLNTGKFII